MALEIHALVLDTVEALPPDDAVRRERLVTGSSKASTQIGLAASEYDPVAYYDMLEAALRAANALGPELAACVTRDIGPPGAAFRAYATLKRLRAELSARLYD